MRHACQVNETAPTQSNLQLCYLQISQAVPISLNYILYLFDQALYGNLKTGFLAVSSGVSFSEALSDLQASYRLILLKVFLNLTNDLAHCFHIYLYILFSRRFREGARKRLQCFRTSQ